VTRVALLTPTYWPEVRRGGERLAHDLARHTGATIVTGSPGPPESGVVRLRRLPEQRLARRQFESHLGHLPALYAHLRRTPYDLVHAFHHADAATAIRAGAPTVWTFLGVPHRRGLANRRLRLRLVTEAAHADAVVALSHTAAGGFRRWLGVDPHVIHPGVDLDAFTPGGERAERFTILCPAALAEPFKRADVLLDAFARVRRAVGDARMILQAGGPAGEGIEHRDLDRHEDLVAAYREAHVTALASEGEAFGLVLVESLACGTPAVGRSEATPLTFDGSAEDLARKILDARWLDPSNCREHAERFDIRKTAEKHDALYRHVLAAREH
jgi:glycosyltransferase involved in cell wall biosynthesis